MKTGTVLVLLVEDDPMAMVPMSLLLVNDFSLEIDRPVEVMVAESLHTARELISLDLSGIDVVIMDGRIIGGTTFELIRLIRAGGFRGPMVTFSGEGEAFIDQMMSEGCYVRLEKPIDSEALLQVLKKRLTDSTDTDAAPPF